MVGLALENFWSRSGQKVHKGGPSGPLQSDEVAQEQLYDLCGRASKSGDEQKAERSEKTQANNL